MGDDATAVGVNHNENYLSFYSRPHSNGAVAPVSQNVMNSTDAVGTAAVPPASVTPSRQKPRPASDPLSSRSDLDDLFVTCHRPLDLPNTTTNSPTSTQQINLQGLRTELERSGRVGGGLRASQSSSHNSTFLAAWDALGSAGNIADTGDGFGTSQKFETCQTLKSSTGGFNSVNNNTNNSGDQFHPASSSSFNMSEGVIQHPPFTSQINGKTTSNHNIVNYNNNTVSEFNDNKSNNNNSNMHSYVHRGSMSSDLLMMPTSSTNSAVPASRRPSATFSLDLSQIKFGEPVPTSQHENPGNNNSSNIHNNNITNTTTINYRSAMSSPKRHVVRSPRASDVGGILDDILFSNPATPAARQQQNATAADTTQQPIPQRYFQGSEQTKYRDAVPNSVSAVGSGVASREKYDLSNQQTKVPADSFFQRSAIQENQRQQQANQSSNGIGTGSGPSGSGASGGRCGARYSSPIPSSDSRNRSIRRGFSHHNFDHQNDTTTTANNINNDDRQIVALSHIFRSDGSSQQNSSNTKSRSVAPAARISPMHSKSQSISSSYTNINNTNNSNNSHNNNATTNNIHSNHTAGSNITNTTSTSSSRRWIRRNSLEMGDDASVGRSAGISRVVPMSGSRGGPHSAGPPSRTGTKIGTPGPATTNSHINHYNNFSNLGGTGVARRAQSAQRGHHQSSSSSGGLHQSEPLTLDATRYNREPVRKTAIEFIIGYLNSKNFPHQLEPKHTNPGPPKPCYTEVLRFLISQIDFETAREPFAADERVPKFFKEIGYPYHMANSHMKSPTAPTTWPQHLAAMTWLCALLKFSEEVIGDFRQKSTLGSRGASGRSLSCPNTAADLGTVRTPRAAESAYRRIVMRRAIKSDETLSMNMTSGMRGDDSTAGRGGGFHSDGVIGSQTNQQQQSIAGQFSGTGNTDMRGGPTTTLKDWKERMMSGTLDAWSIYLEGAAEGLPEAEVIQKLQSVVDSSFADFEASVNSAHECVATESMELKLEIKALQSRMTDVETLCSRVETTRGEVMRLKGQTIQTETAIADKRSNIENFRGEILRAEHRIEQLFEEKERLRITVDGQEISREEVKRYRTDIAHQQKRLEESRAERRRMTERNAELARRVENLTDSIECGVRHSATTVAELSELTAGANDGQNKTKAPNSGRRGVSILLPPALAPTVSELTEEEAAAFVPQPLKSVGTPGREYRQENPDVLKDRRKVILDRIFAVEWKCWKQHSRELIDKEIKMIEQLNTKQKTLKDTLSKQKAMEKSKQQTIRTLRRDIESVGIDISALKAKREKEAAELAAEIQAAQESRKIAMAKRSNALVKIKEKLTGAEERQKAVSASLKNDWDHRYANTLKERKAVFDFFQHLSHLTTEHKAACLQELQTGIKQLQDFPKHISTSHSAQTNNTMANRSGLSRQLPRSGSGTPTAKTSTMTSAVDGQARNVCQEGAATRSNNNPSKGGGGETVILRRRLEHMSMKTRSSSVIKTSSTPAVQTSTMSADSPVISLLPASPSNEQRRHQLHHERQGHEWSSKRERSRHHSRESRGDKKSSPLELSQQEVDKGVAALMSATAALTLEDDDGDLVMPF